MEKIICAAVKINDEIFKGHRHCHALEAMRDKLSYTMNRQQMNVLNEEQGFITSENRFVDRVEAMLIAIEAGQVNISKSKELLYSEDLY